MTFDTACEIAAVLQDGYGDASQTVLDLQVSGAVERRLLELGWLPPDQVRALVASAGGRISVPITTLMDPPREAFIHEDFRNGARVIEVR